MPAVQELTSYIMVFGLVAIMGMIVLYIIATIETTIPNETDEMAQAAGNATLGITTMLQFLPLLAVVLISAIVLSVLLYDLFRKGSA